MPVFRPVLLRGLELVVAVLWTCLRDVFTPGARKCGCREVLEWKKLCVVGAISDVRLVNGWSSIGGYCDDCIL